MKAKLVRESLNNNLFEAKRITREEIEKNLENKEKIIHPEKARVNFYNYVEEPGNPAYIADRLLEATWTKFYEERFGKTAGEKVIKNNEVTEDDIALYLIGEYNYLVNGLDNSRYLDYVISELVNEGVNVIS